VLTADNRNLSRKSCCRFGLSSF